MHNGVLAGMMCEVSRVMKTLNSVCNAQKYNLRSPLKDAEPGATARET